MVQYTSSKPYSFEFPDDSDHWKRGLTESSYQYLKKHDLWAVKLQRFDEEALGPYNVKYWQDSGPFTKALNRKYYACCYEQPKTGRLINVFFDRTSFQRSEIPKELDTAGCTCPEWGCALFFGFASTTQSIKTLFFVVHPQYRLVFQKRFQPVFKEVKDEWQTSTVQCLIRQLHDYVKMHHGSYMSCKEKFANEVLNKAKKKIKEEISEAASVAVGQLFDLAKDSALPLASVATAGTSTLVKYSLDKMMDKHIGHQLRKIGNGMDDKDLDKFYEKRRAMLNQKKEKSKQDSKKETETDVDVDVDETLVYGYGPLTLEIKDPKALLAKANKGGEIKVEAKVSDEGQLILNTGNGGKGAPAKVVGFLQKNFKKRELDGKLEGHVPLKKAKTMKA